MVVLPAPARPSRGGVSVAALTPLGHEPALLVGQVWMPGKCAIDVAVGDQVGAPVQALGEPGGDAFLDLEHLDGRVERLVTVGERDDVA